jgi:hypothetical protein
MELSPEEERHLANLSVFPTAVVTYILIIFFLYFGQNEQSLSVFYYLTYFGIPFAVVIPMTLFLSFEILYSHRAKTSISGQLKRFSGRMLLILLGVFVFVIVFGITYFALSYWVEQWNVLLIAAIFWFAIWIPLTFRFKETFSKFYSGKW